MYILLFYGVVRVYRSLLAAQENGWWWVNKYCNDNGIQVKGGDKEIFKQVTLPGQNGYEVAPGVKLFIYEREFEKDICTT
jgi:hypothetical protein